MKLRTLFILGLLAHGSAKADDEVLTSETKCRKALGLIGAAKPVKLIFPFTNWGSIHAGDNTARNTGLVEVLNRSFTEIENKDHLVGLGDCTVSGDNWVILKLFVKPSLPEYKNGALQEFPYEVKIKFDRDAQGNPVTIKTDINRDLTCRSLVGPLLNSYFYDANSGKSASFVSNWEGRTNPLQESVASYCKSFVEKFDQVIYNQFK